MNDFLADIRHEFVRHKGLADRAMARLDDQEIFRRPGTLVNPVALIVKHLAGNMISRWTDFLTTDGEKASRDRDGEFLLTEQDTRPNLLAAWESGWAALFDTLAGLNDADLEKMVTIRGESQTVRQALLRGMSHVAYHTGQVLYLVRLLRPESPWLTIPPGQSRGFPGNYRQSWKSEFS
jgi:uncharacterized damage-inducible protein DinB